MGATILFFLAVAAGAGLALQAPTNAILARALDSPIWAAFVSFAVGTLALGLVSLFTPGRLAGAGLRGLPWHAWIGGFYGVFFVTFAAIAAPRIGVAALLTAAIAGQLVAGMLVDQFGWFGLPVQPIGVARLIGLFLVIGGAAIVRFA